MATCHSEPRPSRLLGSIIAIAIAVGTAWLPSLFTDRPPRLGIFPLIACCFSVAWFYAKPLAALFNPTLKRLPALNWLRTGTLGFHTIARGLGNLLRIRPTGHLRPA